MSTSVSIHLPFATLSPWQQIAFAAALIERMLPNYQLFSTAADFGDAKVLRNQLDLIWQWLANSTGKENVLKINIEAQLAKLELQTPDPDIFDFFGAYCALDACMALTALWQIMLNLQPKKLTRKVPPQEADVEDIQSISLLSYSSVNAYIELQLTDGYSESEQIDLAVIAQEISQHALMEWEIAMQNELFNFLKFAAENQRSCQLAKEMMLAEGLSNLGLDIC